MLTATRIENPPLEETVASNALEVAWQLAIRSAMSRDDLDRALAPQGIYAQRQRDRYLLRVKVPRGQLAPSQLRKLADMADTLPEPFVHLTTRQDVELNSIAPDGLPPLLDALAAAGLSTRETGGNTVRNVTVCPLAGACPREVFDVRPYAAQLDTQFRGLGQRSMLPRKFKIALSGCRADCALARIHDLGAVAIEDSSGVATFRVYVGGGLGSLPRLAECLDPSLPARSLPRLARALVHVFQQEGDFEHRQRARLKFLVQRVGLDQLRRWVRRLCDGEIIAAGFDDLADEPLADDDLYTPMHQGADDDLEMARWRCANVFFLRQSDRYAVVVAAPAGNVTAKQLRLLAHLCELHHLDGVSVIVDQNILLSGIAARDLPAVWKGLSGTALVELGGRAGLTTCPGSALCRRAITSSAQLARELNRLLPPGWPADPAFAGTQIKISGCPNSCSRPQVATIGLVGCAGHAHGRVYPAYRLYLGGGVVRGRTALARQVMRVPARRAPQVVLALFVLYRKTSTAAETFVQFAGRVDDAALHGALAQYAAAPEPSDDRCYVDWGSRQPFSVEDVTPYH